ncbi:MAG: MFS transporter [Anaerolineales bacterium]|nr:MFS transporter [Anaerolineales bacterium]
MSTIAIAEPMSPTNKQRWIYCLANFGLVIPAQMVGFVLFFFTDIKRLPVAIASGVMFAYSLWDAINNPIMGYISDRTKSKWGRRIPYLKFGAVPFALSLILIWLAPYDGVEQTTALMLYMIFVPFLWEGLGTMTTTAYYALLPEMFISYEDRTKVAVSMNIIQVVGLFIGMAGTPVLTDKLGWVPTAAIFAVITIITYYVGLPGMFERESSVQAESVPFKEALKATFINRSFISVVVSQTFRFVGTGTLTTGVLFYVKYSLDAGESFGSVILGVAFIVSAITLELWRRLIAARFEARTTLMIANGVMGISVIPLGIAPNATTAAIAAAGLGLGLAGLILLGDVIVADVIDEDEVKTGQRREGMYFGMSKFIMKLSGSIVALWFGWIAPAFGYDSALSIQPESVATGFRVFMTVPVIVSSILAILALFFYPLYGERLQAVKDTLAARHADQR